MSIRNATKAILLHENKILLNPCNNPVTGPYYSLPGGGQLQYETMEENLIRECLEETGYAVTVEAFVGLYEEIYTRRDVREAYPNHTHKVMHLFRCRLAGEARRAPTEEDAWQAGCVWVPVGEVPGLRVLPAVVGARMEELVRAEGAVFLGSEMVEGER